MADGYLSEPRLTEALRRVQYRISDWLKELATLLTLQSALGKFLDCLTYLSRYNGRADIAGSMSEHLQGALKDKGTLKRGLACKGTDIFAFEAFQIGRRGKIIFSLDLGIRIAGLEIAVRNDGAPLPQRMIREQLCVSIKVNAINRYHRNALTMQVDIFDGFEQGGDKEQLRRPLNEHHLPSE